MREPLDSHGSSGLETVKAYSRTANAQTSSGNLWRFPLALPVPLSYAFGTACTCWSANAPIAHSIPKIPPSSQMVENVRNGKSIL